MRWIVVLLIHVGLAASAGLADDVAHRVQIEAATSEASDSIRREILSIPLGTDTVGTLIDLTSNWEKLDTLMQTAQQIGGTRWMDDQTVQIRVELKGDNLSKMLDKIVERNPHAVSISVRSVRDILKKDVAHRMFSATGTCTAASAADRFKPYYTQFAWRTVSDADRRFAIDAARLNAANHAEQSLSTVTWDYGKRHLSEAMALPQVADATRAWLVSRPITGIEFRDNLEVRISLAASPRDLWPPFRELLNNQVGVATPHDAREWDALKMQIERHMAAAIGVAAVKGNIPAAQAPQPAPLIPHQPPAWVELEAETEGVSASVGNSKLRTARAAEANALQLLRGRINALALAPNVTLGDASVKDPRIEQAIGRSLSQARIARVEYDTPGQGAVRVTMKISLDDVWREIAK